MRYESRKGIFFFLFSQTSHSSTWIVGCRKRLYKCAPSLQEKHTFTFWIMVLPNGHYIAPTSVIHVGKVMIEEQNFTLNLGKIILGGPYQIYTLISLANQANRCIYLLLKVIDSNFCASTQHDYQNDASTLHSTFGWRTQKNIHESQLLKCEDVFYLSKLSIFGFYTVVCPKQANERCYLGIWGNSDFMD